MFFPFAHMLHPANTCEPPNERSETIIFGPEGLKRAAERSRECGALKNHAPKVHAHAHVHGADSAHKSCTRSEKITARSDLHAHVIVSKLRTHARAHIMRTRAFKCALAPEGCQCTYMHAPGGCMHIRTRRVRLHAPKVHDRTK